MNDLVDVMNDVLRSAVETAGPRVHFIDYDKYVGVTGGRYCQPGRDENLGRGANLPNLFFYQMRTIDQAWQIPPPPPETIFERGQSEEAKDLGAANGTLGAIYGALLQQAIEELVSTDGYAAIDDENANPDLEELIEDELDENAVEDSDSGIKIRARSVDRRWSRRSLRPPFARTSNGSARVAPSWNVTIVGGEHVILPSHRDQAPRLGSKVYIGRDSQILSTASFARNQTRFRFGNATNSTEGLSVGTVVANNTHIMLAGVNPTPYDVLRRLFVPDKTGRVFHPTQGGHALIANLILYQMRVDRATRKGTPSITHYPRADRPLMCSS